MKFWFLKINVSLRYLFKKIIIFVLSTRRDERKNRSDEARRKSKHQKKIIFEDLRTGNKLGEIELSEKEVNIVNLHFLGEFIPLSVAIEMYKKHRGYKISENPAIYKKLSKKR